MISGCHVPAIVLTGTVSDAYSRPVKIHANPITQDNKLTLWGKGRLPEKQLSGSAPGERGNRGGKEEQVLPHSHDRNYLKPVRGAEKPGEELPGQAGATGPRSAVTLRWQPGRSHASRV